MTKVPICDSSEQGEMINSHPFLFPSATAQKSVSYLKFVVQWNERE